MHASDTIVVGESHWLLGVILPCEAHDLSLCIPTCLSVGVYHGPRWET